jgi:hypothetical protein
MAELPKFAKNRLDAGIPHTDVAEQTPMQRKGWTGQQIAEELGWERASVQRHKSIRDNLHPRAWDRARYGVPKNDGLGTVDGEDVGTLKVPNGTWSESHFRSFLSALPCTDYKKTPGTIAGCLCVWGLCMKANQHRIACTTNATQSRDASGAGSGYGWWLQKEGGWYCERKKRGVNRSAFIAC